MEALFVVESLIALEALGGLARADGGEKVTIDGLLVLLLGIFLLFLLLSVLFLHGRKHRGSDHSRLRTATTDLIQIQHRQIRFHESEFQMRRQRQRRLHNMGKATQLTWALKIIASRCGICFPCELSFTMNSCNAPGGIKTECLPFPGSLMTGERKIMVKKKNHC